jgi:hypothetical protein
MRRQILSIVWAYLVVAFGAIVIVPVWPIETWRSHEQEHANALDAAESTSIRAHMHRVQTSFDETNDSLWFRIAFVATIIDIRPVRGDDILIGTIPEGETEVAVLRIHAVGSSKQSTLQQDTVIVCPVGKERDLWLRWLNQKSEMLFEYNRIGNRQFVQKCGC